jgi:hypothetical protein
MEGNPERQHTPPTVRVRVAHEQTAKGWRTKETTVEVQWQNVPLAGDTDDYRMEMVSADKQSIQRRPMAQVISDLLQEVDWTASEETERRNRRDHPGGDA